MFGAQEYGLASGPSAQLVGPDPLPDDVDPVPPRAEGLGPPSSFEEGGARCGERLGLEADGLKNPDRGSVPAGPAAPGVLIRVHEELESVLQRLPTELLER